MSDYIIGSLLTLLVIIFHSSSNIFDNFLVGKIFIRLTHLIFFSALINLIFIAFCFFIGFPQLVNIKSFSIIFMISLINIFYQFPYYWSLRRTDTSIVVSLFSLAKIFTPLLAFVFLKEQLFLIQYIGFFLIILSSVLLTLNWEKLEFSSTLFLMFIVSLIITLQGVLFKSLFEQGVTWINSVLWVGLFDFLIATSLILLPKNLYRLKESFKSVKKNGRIFLLNQFLSWGGEALSMLALYYIPVSIYSGFTSTQPIFVLLLAYIFSSRHQPIFKEIINAGMFKKKLLLFLIMALGTILIVI